MLGFLTPAKTVKPTSKPNDVINAWLSSIPNLLRASLTPPAIPLILDAVLPKGAAIPNHSAGVFKNSPTPVSYSFVAIPRASYTAL